MSDKNGSDLGNQIMDIVSDAIQTQDFTKLNKKLQDTITAAFGESQKKDPAAGKTGIDIDPDVLTRQVVSTAKQTGKVVASVASQIGKEVSASLGHSSSYATAKRYKAQPRQRPYPQPKKEQPMLYPATLISRSPKGKVSQTVSTVFGSLSFSVAGCLGAATLITLAAGGMSAIPVLLTLTGCFGVFGAYLLGNGSRTRKRLQRFYRYCSVLQGNTYCYIKDMATAVNRSQKYVIKDLTRMIEDKMFPQGHFDTEYTTFILSNETFNQYLISMREKEHQERLQSSETEQDRAFREAYALGEQYLRQISDANDEIPGKEISDKLDRLEGIIRRIFEQIKEHPEQLPELRKFMDYYLPTTLKLVETYRQLYRQPAAGPNIKNTMAEIEASLDTIILAFEKLFDSLFADTALDVSTDISVLNTMLAKEGLTKDPF